MITKADKALLIKLFKSVDVEQLDIDNPESVKWFRFGSYNGLQIACEIVNNLPEKNKKIS